MNIYQINNQLIEFFDSLPDGEIDEQGLVQLEGLQMEKREKQKNIILYKKNLDRGIEAIDNEIKYLQEMKRVQSNKSDRLTNLLIFAMGDEREIDFDTCGAKFKKNPPKLVIDDESKVPYTFIKEKITTSIDKTALKKEVQEGLIIEGVRIEQGERIDIY